MFDRKKYMQDYCQKHKKRIKKYKHQWYLNNREKVSIGHKRYYQDHREEALKRINQYHKDYPEKRKKYYKRSLGRLKGIVRFIKDYLNKVFRLRTVER